MKGNIKWRRGLGAAATRERFVLLEAEHHARQRAIQESCLDRLERSGGILCDCTGVAVRSCQIRWGRSAGCLYIRVTVSFVGTDRNRVYNWRKAMPRRRR